MDPHSTTDLLEKTRYALVGLLLGLQARAILGIHLQHQGLPPSQIGEENITLFRDGESLCVLGIAPSNGTTLP